jgi:triosephosphate isomerase
MKALVVANWKIGPLTLKLAKKLLVDTKKAAERVGMPVIVAPSMFYLRELSALSRGTRIRFAAQNAHYTDSGAHTGEVSLKQLKDARVSYVLVGHAERRAMGETNDDTRKKVGAALLARMTPILCVGEEKRSGSGEHFSFIREQLQVGCADVPQEKLKQVIVAYEPVWAIGADKPLSPRGMHEMAIFIRKTLVDLKGESAMAVKILYGGSVDETSAPHMLRMGDVDGLLVGRASTSADSFAKLLETVKEA